MRARARPIGLVVALLALFAAVAAAWVLSRPEGSGPCSSPLVDPLDPRSLQHALGDAPPSYATEPPTSGPHQAGPASGGVVTEPLPGPVQVGALEAGHVLLQHRDLHPAERTRLEALASPQVIVAPNPALPSPVVASAWRTRQLCTSVDEPALKRFISKYAGRPHQHG